MLRLSETTIVNSCFNLYLVMLYDEEGGGRKLQVVFLHELWRRSGTQIASVIQGRLINMGLR